jgi:hypothetical protein|tara:strand:- start:198 stop:326 length:129 start_codon:yes stop_codon:yes gene_type:complete
VLLEGFKETIEIGAEKDTNQNLKRRATFAGTTNYKDLLRNEK